MTYACLPCIYLWCDILIAFTGWSKVHTVEPWLYPNLHYPNPWLSEHYFKFYNATRQFDFLQNEAINEIPVGFSDLLGIHLSEHL